MNRQIHQGQKYLSFGHEFLALENSQGGTVKVARIDHELSYPLHPAQWMHSSMLTPLPVRRFHGEVR